MIAVLLAALGLAAGAVQAGTPLRPLQQEAARADAVAVAAENERIDQSRAVQERLHAIDAATAQVEDARAPAGFDDKKLALAIDALARAKAATDAAVARERAAMVGAVQADAVGRAARQALTDAVTEWSAEGDALTRAAAHAAAGDVARTAREHRACLDQDCSPVSAREHAALVIIGAVGPLFDLKDWPAEAAREITLLPPATPQKTLVRSLRAAATSAASAAREAQDSASKRQGPLAAAQSTQSAALQTLLDAYFRPTATSHAQETIAMAADDYAAIARQTGPLAEPAPPAADTAAGLKKPAEDARDRMLMFFGDAGRATQRAALLAGRGASLAAAGTGLAICRGKICEPTSGLEAAAFVVIGAAAPGAEKSLGALVEMTADGRAVFRLPQ